VVVEIAGDERFCFALAWWCGSGDSPAVIVGSIFFDTPLWKQFLTNGQERNTVVFMGKISPHGAVEEQF
jgi:hypothetical protein